MNYNCALLNINNQTLRILCSHQKKWDLAICNDVDGTGGYYAEWNKSIRERHVFLKDGADMVCRMININETLKVWRPVSNQHEIGTSTCWPSTGWKPLLQK